MDLVRELKLKRESMALRGLYQGLMSGIFGDPATFRARVEAGCRTAVWFTLIPLAALAFLSRQYLLLGAAVGGILAFGIVTLGRPAQRGRPRDIPGLHRRPDKAYHARRRLASSGRR